MTPGPLNTPPVGLPLATFICTPASTHKSDKAVKLTTGVANTSIVSTAALVQDTALAASLKSNSPNKSNVQVAPRSREAIAFPPPTLLPQLHASDPGILL